MYALFRAQRLCQAKGKRQGEQKMLPQSAGNDVPMYMLMPLERARTCTDQKHCTKVTLEGISSTEKSPKDVNGEQHGMP